MSKGRATIQTGEKGRQKPHETQQGEMQNPASPCHDRGWELPGWGQNKIHMRQPRALAAKKDSSTLGYLNRSMARGCSKAIIPLCSALV